MKFLKVNLIASDALVADNYSYVNVDEITAINATGATCLVGIGHDTVMTCTFDGGSAAIKLTNAAKFAGWLTGKLAKQADGTILDLFGVMTIAEIHTEIGLTAPGTNDAFVSIAIA